MENENKKPHIKTIEEYLADNKELLEGYKKLEEVNFDSRRFLGNAYESIFKEAYEKFINSNIDRIKYFITSDSHTKPISEKFDVQLEDTVYRFKDELFSKIDSYRSTEKGEVELWLMDYKILQEKVKELPNNIFDDIKKEVEESNGTFDLEKEKLRFNVNLEEIIEKINQEVRNDYVNNKIHYADIPAVDSIFDEKHFKLISDRSKNDKNMKINNIALSTNNVRNKIIKKISKDVIRLGEKSSKDDEEVISTLLYQISELWSILLLYRRDNFPDLDSAIKYIKEKESEKDKELELFMAKNRNFMYKLFYEAFKERESRIVIPALVKAFYSAEDITKTYLFDKLMNEVLKIYPVSEEEVSKGETASSAL